MGINLIRIIIGFCQGLAVNWILKQISLPHNQTISYAYLFLTLAIGIIPLIYTQGLGLLRQNTLLKHTIISIILLFIATIVINYYFLPSNKTANVIIDQYPIFKNLYLFQLYTALFIGQALALTYNKSHQLRTQYSIYFEQSWGLLTQTLLALIFVGVVLIICFIGDMLLETVNIKILAQCINEEWFYTTSLAIGFTLTNIKPNLINATKNALLTLISWVLPLLDIIIIIFILSIAINKTVNINSVSVNNNLPLLSCSIMLIILINAVYKDGWSNNLTSPLLKLSMNLSIILLFIICCINIVTFCYLVHTKHQSFHPILITLSMLYAIGYITSLASKKHKDKIFNYTNIFLSYISIIVLIFSIT
jgi:hypothetical protein